MKKSKCQNIFFHPNIFIIWSHESTENKIRLLASFLHSPFCGEEGLCQQAAIKQHPTLNGPIRAKQKNSCCTVIGLRVSWGLSHINKLVLQYSTRGQTWQTECTVVQSRLALASEELYRAVVYTGLKGTVTGLKYKCTEIQLIAPASFTRVCQKG